MPGSFRDGGVPLSARLPAHPSHGIMMFHIPEKTKYGAGFRSGSPHRPDTRHPASIPVHFPPERHLSQDEKMRRPSAKGGTFRIDPD